MEISPMRPGGELKGVPVQGLDGQWYDIYGKKISKDKAFANLFWKKQEQKFKNEKFVKQLKETMEENIETGYKNSGKLGSFVDPKGITQEDKEKLSAYRLLAEELGYQVGEYKFDSNSFIASAKIDKTNK